MTYRPSSETAKVSRWAGVRDIKRVGEVGDEFVAAVDGSNLCPLFLKGGKDEHSVFFERRFPILGNLEMFDFASRAKNDARFAVEELSQALLFNGGMKAADDGYLGIGGPGFELVVGFEDFIRWAFAGAEQALFMSFQQIGVADGGKGLAVGLDGLDWVHRPLR